MLIKIYIAGKVTGLPAEDVKEKFLRKEKELTAQGYTVYNPVDQLWVKGGQTWTWEKLMRGCITQMMECDEVHFLNEAFMGSRTAGDGSGVPINASFY